MREPVSNPIHFRLTWAGLAAMAVVLVLIFWGFLSLAGWISVPQGHFVVLIQKTGNDLKNEEVLATSAEFKGVHLDVLKEGYHFFNPYSYTWTKPIEATVIPEMQVGILTRKYGKALPVGQVLAETEDQKGIVREPYSPGRYYLNTFAYGIEMVPMVRIDPGFMGVVTLLVGKEPANPNVFVVGEGERGTQPFLLPPGIHPQYSNKWVYKVVPVDMRSQKIEMAAENAVDFPSQDGFPIHTEGTIEYALDLKKLPELFVTFVDTTDLEASGGLKNIEEKFILPEGRSLYRIYGAQHRAVDYLIGSTRLAVQSQIESELRETCAKEGILIRSFVIRSTDPPAQIRDQYERREVAKRQQDQYLAEITTEIGYPAVEGGKPKLDANGQPMFDRGVPIVEGGKPKLDAKGNVIYEGGRLSKELQTRMKDRAEALGTVAVEVANVTRAAEQYGLVEMTKANQNLDVAKLQLDAANDLAAKKTAAGDATATVIRLKNEAQAAGVQTSVSAFGSGDKYAQYLLTTHFAPAIKNIWSNTDGFFTTLFKSLASPRDGSAGAGGGSGREAAMKRMVFALLILVAAFLVLYMGVWRWGIERTWVPANYSLQLTRLTGNASPKDAYAGAGQQGVVEQMLGPGRHFMLPWEYSTKKVADFEVPPGQIALIRNNVGKDLPEGRFLAQPDEKGTQQRILTPGVYRLNEFGQTHYVQPEFAGKGNTQPMVYIPPGYVGVQTLAEGNNKGILPAVLQAGYYALNPEQVKVNIIGIGYDVLDMHVDYTTVTERDAAGKTVTLQKPKEGTGISFPLADGKQMYLDITVVWGVFPADAPRIVSDYGTLDMLEEKVIMPQVLSICKNAGSDLTTRDFIAGNTRDKFQEKVTSDLQKIGQEKGIHFLIALVRGFHPDPQISQTIQARMVAEEEIITLGVEQQRDTVAAQLEAARRKVATALQDFNAETTALVAEQRQEGLKSSATVKAEADRKVAGLERQVAELDAQGVKINGKAEADVLANTSKAEAELMKLLITAYGGADSFNLATFAKNLPEDLKIEYHYAGPGTLWTDMTQNVQELAARKIVASEAGPATQPAGR